MFRIFNLGITELCLPYFVGHQPCELKYSKSSQYRWVKSSVILKTCYLLLNLYDRLSLSVCLGEGNSFFHSKTNFWITAPQPCEKHFAFRRRYILEINRLNDSCTAACERYWDDTCIAEQKDKSTECLCFKRSGSWRLEISERAWETWVNC